MKKPPFKIDSSFGRLEWLDRDGKMRATAGRLTYLWVKLAEQTVQGGSDFRMKLAGGKRRYPVRLTEREAWNVLNSTAMRAMLARAKTAAEAYTLR